MKIQVLDRAKKKKFIQGSSDLGLKKISETLIRTGKERIRAFSGSLSTEEIYSLWRILPIEGIGLYIGKESVDRSGVRETRLSLDGLHSYSDQITSNILILTKAQEEEWFKGKNIELSNDQLEKFKDLGKGFVAVKSSDSKDFVGTAKIGGQNKDTLFGFLPKERRRKSQTL